MKIVIIGATGKLGRHLLGQALDGGHEVVAYVRDATALEDRAHLSIVQGQLDDPEALRSALTGADVVICAIAPRIPMSQARKPTDLMQRLLPGILAAVEEAGARLVLVSAFGVGASADKASGPARLVYRTITRGLFEDKRVAELGLDHTRVDWTVVLPVNLKEAKASGEVAVKNLDDVAKVPGLPTLSFADAAGGILQVAVSPDARGQQRVLITSAGGWR